MTEVLYSLINSAPFSDFMCSHVTGSTGSRQRTIPSDTLQYAFHPRFSVVPLQEQEAARKDAVHRCPETRHHGHP